MNQNLFEKQLKELQFFFEKPAKHKIILNKRQHIDILNALFFTLSKCSEHIDFTNYYSNHVLETRKNKHGIQHVIESKLKEITSDESIEYADVLELLKIFIHCFSDNIKLDINTDEWLSLAEKIRVLEMERLSIQPKIK